MKLRNVNMFLNGLVRIKLPAMGPYKLIENLRDLTRL